MLGIHPRNTLIVTGLALAATFYVAVRRINRDTPDTKRRPTRRYVRSRCYGTICMVFGDLSRSTHHVAKMGAGPALVVCWDLFTGYRKADIVKARIAEI